MSNFKSVHENNSILSDYNGRVNIVQPPSMEEQFKMMEKIQLDNKCVSYRGALDGIQENNLLSKLFFSAENMQIVQNGIKAGVYKKSNGRFQIADQDEDTLKIIMRSIFLQHSTNLPNNISQQVAAINKMVIDYSVPQIYGEAVSYVKYKNDVSTLVVPIDRPTSTYENNTLEWKSWF